MDALHGRGEITGASHGNSARKRGPGCQLSNCLLAKNRVVSMLLPPRVYHKLAMYRALETRDRESFKSGVRVTRLFISDTTRTVCDPGLFTLRYVPAHDS